MHRRKRSPLGLALVLALTSIVVAVPAAWAGDHENAPEKKAEKKQRLAIKAPCEERPFARVFEPWNDRRLYTLAPGGDFETASSAVSPA